MLKVAELVRSDWEGGRDGEREGGREEREREGGGGRERGGMERDPSLSVQYALLGPYSFCSYIINFYAMIIEGIPCTIVCYDIHTMLFVIDAESKLSYQRHKKCAIFISWPLLSWSFVYCHVSRCVLWQCTLYSWGSVVQYSRLGFSAAGLPSPY